MGGFIFYSWLTWIRTQKSVQLFWEEFVYRKIFTTYCLTFFITWARSSTVERSLCKREASGSNGLCMGSCKPAKVPTGPFLIYIVCHRIVATKCRNEHVSVIEYFVTYTARRKWRAISRGLLRPDRDEGLPTMLEVPPTGWLIGKFL